VDDLVEGVYLLMQADPARHPEREQRFVVEGPGGMLAIIGGGELVQTGIDVSGKDIRIEYVEGPVGVHSRNFSKERIKSLGWEAQVPFKEGIARTYRWIEEQVRVSKGRV